MSHERVARKLFHAGDFVHLAFFVFVVQCAIRVVINVELDFPDNREVDQTHIGARLHEDVDEVSNFVLEGREDVQRLGHAASWRVWRITSNRTR